MKRFWNELNRREKRLALLGALVWFALLVWGMIEIHTKMNHMPLAVYLNGLLFLTSGFLHRLWCRRRWPGEGPFNFLSFEFPRFTPGERVLNVIAFFFVECLLCALIFFVCLFCYPFI